VTQIWVNWSRRSLSVEVLASISSLMTAAETYFVPLETPCISSIAIIVAYTICTTDVLSALSLTLTRQESAPIRVRWARSDSISVIKVAGSMRSGWILDFISWWDIGRMVAVEAQRISC